METPAIERQRRLEFAWTRYKEGDFLYAYEAYRQLAHDFPEDSVVLHRFGILQHRAGHAEAAINLIRKSIALDATDPRAFNHLGQIYAASKEYAMAEECFREALTLDPALPEALNNLGNIVQQTRDPAEARRLYERAIALSPSMHQGHYNLAKLLRNSRAFDDALRSFERSLELNPTNYRAGYELALCLEELGRFEEAIERYQATLLTNPDHGRSIANLLALQSFEPDDKFLARALRIASAEGVDFEIRAKLHQGIGKYHDRRGDYERAFSHFSACKKIQRAWSKPIATRSVATQVTSLIANFDESYFFPSTPAGHPSTRPTFIVGVPRSGTTLIEQVLASHPDVYGGGELLEMPRIAAAYAAARAVPILEAADRYLNHLAMIAPASATRVTDKLPINYRYLGLIATLFPRVHIIRVCRDPRDVALSCFVELFNSADQDFTTLEGIAESIVLEARLMQHWYRVLPVPILEVDYHRFITDQEAETRRLVSHCELPWSDRCLTFFDTKRFVDTPSRWQVRQPVYTSSDGKWRKYERQLQPAISILKSEGLIGPD